MEEELKELKLVLRSLVVSSPSHVDMRMLLRDYRNMMGEPLPLARFGYRDPLAFLKERCSDCFVIRDPGLNPVLTLIVPDTVKHIDQFVQRQRPSAVTKIKGKRRSVAESAVKDNLIVKSFQLQADSNGNNNCAVQHSDKVNHSKDSDSNHSVTTDLENNKEIIEKCLYPRKKQSTEDRNGICSEDALKNFMLRRMPLLNSSQYLETEIFDNKDLAKSDNDSGRATLSTNGSRKSAQLNELQNEVRDLIAAIPEGLWCTELMRHYREKYGRELNFSRFGFTSVQGFACSVPGLRRCVAAHTGQLLLQAEGAPVPARAHPPPHAPAPAPAAHAPAHPPQHASDPDDALPGINFDEDVFPRDCMHMLQSIPAQPLDALAPGAMLQVVVGEVYSPSHFWLLRLGDHHYGAMELIMDEMNQYYRGAGGARALAAGALRVGQYCACCYRGDWHRAVIVKLIDSDTVKVRHIDYATVESASARALRPLLTKWARLPAQALRARLAAVRPSAAGRRWPWAACAHFLARVAERRLVANVVARDLQEGILEVLLIDTSTEEDVCISTELTRAGYADARPDSALGTSECYLFPRFDALETAATPNYADIYCYLRDGISLEFVDDYRRHVPPCLPPHLPPHSSGTPDPEPDPEPEPAPSPATVPRYSVASPSSSSPASLVDLHSPPSAGALRPAGTRPPGRGPSRAASTDLCSSLSAVSVSNRVPLLRPELQPPPRHPCAPAIPPGLGGPPLVDGGPWHATAGPPGAYPGCVAAAWARGAPRWDAMAVSLQDCEIFSLLSRVDPAAAHRFMVEALGRAVPVVPVAPGFEGRAPPPWPRPGAPGPP